MPVYILYSQLTIASIHYACTKLSPVFISIVSHNYTPCPCLLFMIQAHCYSSWPVIYCIYIYIPRKSVFIVIMINIDILCIPKIDHTSMAKF